ncbi:hypothetical protein PISMIDRAFT_89052, partial [Pisolithus microcarpus 441]
VNMINRAQELSTLMVVSYLMGLGDTYCSHRYVNVYWSLFSNFLKDAFLSITSRNGGDVSSPAHNSDDNLPNIW